MPAPLSTKSTLNISLQAALVDIYLNGVYTTIFLVTIYGIYLRKQPRLRYRQLMALVTISMFTLSTLHSVAHWYILWKGFIDKGDTPEDAKTAIKSAVPIWWEALNSVVFSLNTLIADCLFIWRCWVIWGQSWKAALGPAILTVVGTVFSVLADVAQIDGSKDHNTPVLNSKFFVDTGTIYLSFSVATTLLVTILISYRIISVQTMNRELYKSSSGGDETSTSNRIYSNALEIIIESAMLYSIAELALLILLVQTKPVYLYAQDAVAQVTGIAPTLILLRVTYGVARDSTTWTRADKSMGTIVFAKHSDVAPTSTNMRSRMNTHGSVQEDDYDGISGSADDVNIEEFLSNGGRVSRQKDLEGQFVMVTGNSRKE